MDRVCSPCLLHERARSQPSYCPLRYEGVLTLYAVFACLLTVVLLGATAVWVCSPPVWRGELTLSAA